MIVLQIVGAIIVLWLTFGGLALLMGVATVELPKPMHVVFPMLWERFVFVLWLCVLVPPLVVWVLVEDIRKMK